MISVLIGPMYRDASRAERDQQRQRRLRPVGRGAQRVEPEHRDAGEHADPLLPFFVRRQRPAEEVVQYCQPWFSRRVRSLRHRSRKESERAPEHGPAIVSDFQFTLKIAGISASLNLKYTREDSNL